MGDVPKLGEATATHAAAYVEADSRGTATDSRSNAADALPVDTKSDDVQSVGMVLWLGQV